MVPFNEKGKKNWEGIGWGLRDQGSIWRHIKFKMLSFDLSGGQVKQTLGSLTLEQVWLEIWIWESAVYSTDRIERHGNYEVIWRPPGLSSEPHRHVESGPERGQRADRWN